MPELTHAVDFEFQTLEIYEIWHWRKKEERLLCQYINKFLRETMEASGWPASDSNEKNTFLIEMSAKENIQLDSMKNGKQARS